MKRQETLDVAEFKKLVDALKEQAEAEMTSAQARMDAMRCNSLPPG